MPHVRPFAALRPAAQYVAQVAAPPYDVLSSEEARVRAAGKRWSFLHISKPEIDLPRGTDPYADAVYRKAADNLREMLSAGVLVRDAAPCFYGYRLTMGHHVQMGVVMAAAVADYDSNLIRKHEYTRPDKEDDRVRQIEALAAQTGPVLLAYPAAAALDAELAAAASAAPTAVVQADGGVEHAIWVIDDARRIDAIAAAFSALPALYIADGHHRSAAASRVAASRRQSGAAADHPSQFFLAVAFPHDQMRILDYNRLVKDLNDMDVDAFLAKVGTAFDVQPSIEAVRPDLPGSFGLYVDGRWYRLRIDPRLAQDADPVKRLDVSLLADHLLSPILGIHDPRTDQRIDFVGGIRGVGELQRRVDSGEMRAAFSMHPTHMEQLMAVADAGRVMPPKSTWFEPKLADGLASHVID